MTSAGKTWVTIIVILVVAGLIWWYVAGRTPGEESANTTTGSAEMDGVLGAFDSEQSTEASLAAESDADQALATGDAGVMVEYTSAYNENEI